MVSPFSVQYMGRWKYVPKNYDLQKEEMAGDPIGQKIGITTFSS